MNKRNSYYFDFKYDDSVKKVKKEGEQVKLIFEKGNEVYLDILEGTYGDKMIDIRNLHQKTGYYSFDPGFTCTGSCASQITFIDGENSLLLYRGYKIEDLVENCNYLEVCYLLIYGELPNSENLIEFEDLIKSEMIIHSKMVKFYDSFKDGTHPMSIMVGVVGALSAFMIENDYSSNIDQREIIAIKLIAKMPMIAALAFRTSKGWPIVYPKKKYSYMENFLRMMYKIPGKNWEINKDITETMEKIFILHADHEQNASTSTVRVAGSSQANPWACISAAITSLWGPAHGGANEAVIKMLKNIGNKEKLDEFVEKAKQKSSNVRIMGFGHRVYKNFDPRCNAMKDSLEKILNKLDDKDNNFFNLAKSLEEKLLKDEYFIKRKLYPNVDFYTGIIYKAIGIPENMFTVMFAVSRTVGWITQWIEMSSELVKKISRPRQLYVGNQIKKFTKIGDRKKIEKKIVDIPKHGKILKLPKL